jgi:hypothetical protein
LFASLTFRHAGIKLRCVKPNSDGVLPKASLIEPRRVLEEAVMHVPETTFPTGAPRAFCRWSSEGVNAL